MREYIEAQLKAAEELCITRPRERSYWEGHIAAYNDLLGGGLLTAAMPVEPPPVISSEEEHPVIRNKGMAGAKRHVQSLDLNPV